ncbi:MAG: alpha-galactosidase [Bacteroidaceae bacterium]|nr:alpha-galactosidase [Bacteroidaceae bacterium]
MKKLFLSTILLLISALTMAATWEREQLISTRNSSLMLTAGENEPLKIAYYGDRIGEEERNNIHEAWVGLNRDAYPVFGTTCIFTNAMQVTHTDGNMTLDLIVKDVVRSNTNRGEKVAITMTDRVYPFAVTLNYETHYEEDIIETWVEVQHNEKGIVTLNRFDSSYMPIRKGNVWLSHLHGAWAAESWLTAEPLNHGILEIRNTDGSRNGHYNRPEVMFSLDGEPSENQGRVIGAVLCWSGNYSLRIDTDKSHMHHFFAGICNEASQYKLAKGETFVTPRMAYTYSQRGIGGASRNFHKWARNGMVHGCNTQRDILLNSWEGVYLDINEKDMEQMISDFAAMGGELFVMDDGWFGDKYPRTKDNSSLGDWVVDNNKLPKGLQHLINTAHGKGIKFGIWIEPEATNSISELIEKHPDWVLQVKGREPHYGRGGTQLLLDLTNPAVQDFIFGIVDNLLTQHPDIAYIKWDANVELFNYGSTYLPQDRQSHIYIDYHRGLVNVLQRIRNKYPQVVIQACGGGGGRISYGVMPYFDEFWVSDNTDALQRIYMQWATSYFYPAIAMAQHVSASPNHQTGRSVPLKFRFDVAMTGRLGMELQPKDMNDSERDFATRAIAQYKTIRPIIQMGNLYRLVSPFDKQGIASLMYVNDDASQAVFFAYKMEHFNNMNVQRVRMDGLDALKKYKITELNVPADKQPCHLDGKIFTGRLLMNTGIELNLDSEYASRVLMLVEQ